MALFSIVFLSGVALVVASQLFKRRAAHIQEQEFIDLEAQNDMHEAEQKKELPALLTIYLVSEHPIPGDELLEFLLSHNLQFDSQKIFSFSNGQAPQFYIASLSSPGTFNVRTMATEQFPGLSFFLQPADSASPVDDFDAMCNVLFDAKDRFNASLQSHEQGSIDLSTLRAWREELDHELMHE